MADGNGGQRPFQSYINEAKEGRLTVKMDPEEFVYMDRDCEAMKLLIRSLQASTKEIRDSENWWGTRDKTDLVSASVMEIRLREKAKDSDNGNDINTIMEEHYKYIEDIQEVHKVIREKMMAADKDFAARFNAKAQSLGPVTTPLKPRQPGVTTW